MKGDSQPVEVCLRPLRKIQTPIGSSKVLNHQILLQRLVNSTGTPASSYTLQQTLINAQRQTHTLIRLWKHFLFTSLGFLWSIQNPLSKKNALISYHMAQSSIFLHIFPLLLSLIGKKIFVAIKECCICPCFSHEYIISSFITACFNDIYIIPLYRGL